MKLFDNKIHMCLGYFIVIKPYQYNSMGHSHFGFSLCTNRKIPHYNLIYNDGKQKNSINSLKDIMKKKVANANINSMAEYLLSCYDSGFITNLPSFSSLEIARNVKDKFLPKIDVDIFAAVINKKDSQIQTPNDDFSNWARISLDFGGEFIGYEIIDIDFFCDTLLRPNLAEELLENQLVLNPWNLLNTLKDAKTVITLINNKKLLCEPDLKWIPYAIFKY